MNRDLFRFASAAGSGLLLGASMLFPPGGLFAGLVGSSLFIRLTFSGLSRTAFYEFSIFTLALGCASGFWVPAALRGLGANYLESLIGMVLTAAWSAGPHVAIIAVLFRSVRRQSQGLRCAAIGLIVFAADQAILAMPGGVPWTLWGYAAAEAAGLTQLASIGGVPLVSASLAMGAWALSELARSLRCRPRRRLPIAILCSVGFTALLGLPYARFLDEARHSDLPSVHFLAIQPNLPRNERLIPLRPLQLANAERLKRFTEAALRESKSGQTTVVVWPENSLIIEDQLEAGGVEDLLEGIGTYAIAGVSVDRSEGPNAPLRNSIVALDPNGTIEGAVTKAIAVPVIEGEDHSLLAATATRAVGRAATGRKIEPNEDVEPLESSSRAVVLLCFEALFPQIAKARRPEPASVILNLADDSWIASAVPTRQLTTIFRFRAIEQRLPAIRVAHGGMTASFDRFGQPIEALPLDQYGWLELETTVSNEESFLDRMMFLTLPFGTGLLVFFAYPILEGRDSLRGLSPNRMDIRRHKRDEII